MIQNLVESYNIKTVQCCHEGKQNPTKLETPKKKKKRKHFTYVMKLFLTRVLSLQLGVFSINITKKA